MMTVRCLYTLKEHTGMLVSVCALMSASADTSRRTSSMMTVRCQHTLKEHTGTLLPVGVQLCTSADLSLRILFNEDSASC